MSILKGIKDTRATRADRLHLHTESHRDEHTLHAGPQHAVSIHDSFDQMPRPTRTGGGAAPSDEALSPIAGVSLETYAAVVRGISSCNYDPSALPGIAQTHGIVAETWHMAHAGWNTRIALDAAVARRFSDIYHSS